MNVKPTSKTPSFAAGFTLVELLIVIVIIAVLTAIGFPLANRVRASANRTQCVNRLRAWTVAFGGYAADHDGKIAWKNWAPINWETDPAKQNPYLSYWTGGTIDNVAQEDVGAHDVQLQMRHCPAVKDTPGTVHPSLSYAMIRPSPQIANASDYPLASIARPNRFLIMIETTSHTGAPIGASSELSARTKPLTVNGPDLRHDHTVNVVLGDFSVKPMSWKNLEAGISADYWTKLQP